MEAEEWYRRVKEEEMRAMAQEEKKQVFEQIEKDVIDEIRRSEFEEPSEEEIADGSVERFVAPLAAPGLFSIDASQGRSMPFQYPSQVMTCPCCGEEIGVHAVDATFVQRPERELSPLHSRYGYPFDFTSGGLVVDFAGECGCSFSLVFSNHDGTMFAGWFAAGESRDMMKRRFDRASAPRPTAKQWSYLRSLADRAGLGCFVPDDMTRDEAGAAIDDLVCGRLPEFAQGWGISSDALSAASQPEPEEIEPVDEGQANRNHVARIRELDAAGTPRNDSTSLFVKELMPEELAEKYRTAKQGASERGTMRPGALPIEMHPQKRYTKTTKECFHVDDVVFPEGRSAIL